MLSKTLDRAERLQRHMVTLIKFSSHTQTHTHARAHIRMDARTHSEEVFCCFCFDLKEESEDECLPERGREFHITGPMY